VSGTVRFEGNSAEAPLAAGVEEEVRLLAAATGGSVVLFAWSGDTVVCRLRYDPPPQPLVVPLFTDGCLLPGTEAPMHVLLAWLPPDELERRVTALERALSSVRARPLLAMRLARVRTAGRDLVAGGVRGEVTSVAVPVGRDRGRAVAALALIAPSVYLEDLDLATIAADLESIAAHLPSPTDTVPSPA
jgi:DNA-binding IclR family transcriptional regulator